MTDELVMPRLSDTMEEGTIGRWLKAEGDEIHEGEVIAEIETDKATMEFQAYSDGTLLKILVSDGETAPLGSPIAIVGEAGETVPDDAAPEPRKKEKKAKAEEPRPAEPAQAPAPPPSQPAVAASGNGRGGGTVLKVSPIARRMADEAGLDLTRIAGTGSGPEGRIVKADVERMLARGGAVAAQATSALVATAPAAAQPVAAITEAEVRELTPMLKAVASRMAQSKQTVPHFYLTSEIDMTRAAELRRELNDAISASGEKVSVNDLIMRAAAMALVEHPQAHRSYVDGRHVYHPHANVGMAVALDDGLIVPVVSDADTKTVRQIARETRDLASRARSGGLKQREIEGGTFTVSNLGMLDVSTFAAIINPPESGILAVGAVVERAVVRDGQIVARSMMDATLAVDHRACSGADGARLLQTIKRLLQGPAGLLA
jgi:pyruvate dehydrogenase E2 component (dihydrolipoamide acetyltransferase)